MSTEQAAARHQQRVEELCAAAIRALCGEPDLHFRARRLHRGQRALPWFGPHLQPSLVDDDFGSFRGAADAMALRLLHSNDALHRRLWPVDPVARWVFEWLEQCRAEALAPPALPGVAHNLLHRFEQWSLALHRSGLTDSASGLLLYTVAQVGRARVSGQPVLEATEGLIEVTRGAIAPALGAALSGLRREREDQAAYAQHALAIAGHVAAMLCRTEDDAADDAAQDDTGDRESGFSLLFDFDAEVDDAMPSATPGTSRVLDAAAGAYRVFTTAHDVEVRAATLVRAALLAEYRETLDRRIVEQGLNVARLARQLQVLLAVPTRDGWDDDQDAGRIDGRRLAQLIVSPAQRRLFRTERHVPMAHCVVGFLIDCSGSMKQHIAAVTLLVDVFVRALEQAGVASEVLGFTTGAWNGGRAARDWQRAGRPQHPGRLNEVCHLIFKDGDTAWRRARRDIAALMKSDLFREGIDGEAVEWACARLAVRDEERRPDRDLRRLPDGHGDRPGQRRPLSRPASARGGAAARAARQRRDLRFGRRAGPERFLQPQPRARPVGAARQRGVLRDRRDARGPPTTLKRSAPRVLSNHRRRLGHHHNRGVKAVGPRFSASRPASSTSGTGTAGRGVETVRMRVSVRR